ncbi:hypothetical protein MAPG_09527 [Magnaporthiopsis poae ATCC 64411]|uniref:Uncharacterized protein n=1 Tax=Magnaporthiopsis poae (strain ATCC 64411 / 73-15) TaxID=644358 RepID=A0A0C4EA68_MAGP6|nr:hypothetical protein MAPG_09527 [Magnaporthiopsis poae ATCC 64411]
MSQPSQSQPLSATQTAHPTLINLPQPPSNPDTPSEMPGTPTSTTTSLSALSTTAIKDGHRGHAQHTGNHRGHQHHASTTSLEAERADRISRLTGLSNLMTAQRGPGGPAAQNQSAGGVAQQNNQITPTSGQFPPGTIPAQAPAYFDSNGQPVAASGLSDGSTGAGQLRRDTVRGVAAPDVVHGSGGDTPVSVTASQERREARMVDGVATDGAGRAGVAAPEDDDVFVDTTTRSPLPVALQKEQPGQRRQYPQQTASPTAREAVDRIVQRLDEPAAAGGDGPVLGSSKSPDKTGDKLGQFYFEKK